MDESSIAKRIVFKSKEDQIRFLHNVKKELAYSWKEIAGYVGYHDRTVRDWARGVYNMPFDIAQKLSKKSGISLPSDVDSKKWTEHLQRIASKGGKQNVLRNKVVGGDKTRRLKQWRKWWNTCGKHQLSDRFQPRTVRIPVHNELLAEFVGIMMGDGGLTEYQLKVTLHSKDDRKYIKYVAHLIKKLFDVIPAIRPRKSIAATDIVVNRKTLVGFCRSVGLVVGNKVRQQIDIPKWVYRNRKLQIACLRGLFDTDGSVFLHSYISKGKRYAYTKVSFSNASHPLICSVNKLLTQCGLNVRVSKDQKEVRIESKKDVDNFFKMIGTNNPKHLNRYKN